MTSYPNNQTYVIIPEVLTKLNLLEYSKTARKKLDRKFWIWHWDNKDPILKEFAKDPNYKLLTHAEALEKMENYYWKPKEKEELNLQN